MRRHSIGWLAEGGDGSGVVLAIAHSVRGGRNTPRRTAFLRSQQSVDAVQRKRAGAPMPRLSRLGAALDALAHRAGESDGGPFPYFTVAALVVTGAIGALALQPTWWLLLGAFLVLLVVFNLLMALVGRLLGQD